MICGCILAMMLVTEMSLSLMVALGYKQSMLTYGAKVLWFSIMYFSAIVEFHVMFDQPTPISYDRHIFSPVDSHISSVVPATYHPNNQFLDVSTPPLLSSFAFIHSFFIFQLTFRSVPKIVSPCHLYHFPALPY